MASRQRSLRTPHAAASAVLGALVLLGLGATVLATRHVGNAASSPLEPTGAWHSTLLVGAIVALGTYAVASLLALRGGLGSRGLVAAVGCLVQLLPLAAPLLLSTDAYTYWEYGRLQAVHGANPYSTPPSAYPADPGYHAMGSSWHHSPTIYGPLFTWLSSLVAHVAHAAHDAQLVFRSAAAAAMVALVLLLWRSGASSLALVLVGWSPLLALHFAGGGHNDALMMALAVGALVAGWKRPGSAAVLWTAAVAVKWVAIVPLGLELLRLRGRERARAVGRLVVVAVVGIALSTIEYGLSWLHAVRGLSSQSRRTGSLGAARWLGELGLGHRAVVVVLGLVTLAVLAVLAALAVRRRERHLSLAGTALGWLQGWLNPWYTAWGAALVEFEDAPALAVVLSLLLTAVSLRDALPL